MRKFIFAMVMCLTMCVTANAQFFKKIGGLAKNAVANTVGVKEHIDTLVIQHSEQLYVNMTVTMTPDGNKIKLAIKENKYQCEYYNATIKKEEDTISFIHDGKVKFYIKKINGVTYGFFNIYGVVLD